MWSSSCSSAPKRSAAALLMAMAMACSLTPSATAAAAAQSATPPDAGPVAPAAAQSASLPAAPRPPAAGADDRAAATLPLWRADLPQAQAVGDGDLTWFGLRIYHATLWAPQRRFDPAQPFALQLRYYRSISRERLVRTSIDEIRRLSRPAIDDATLARWQTMLTSAFVDVDEGDELTGVYQPAQGMRLYNRQRLLADLNDPALARAFFDIWLNPSSRDQTLRRRLLGAPP